MRPLKITLCQLNMTWENPAVNREILDRKFYQLSNSTNLVILPEMFTTGFTMEPEKHAETMDGPTIHWMTKKAITINACITGSIIIEENGKYFNRLIWAQPDGRVFTYDKRHLFTMVDEGKHYSQGSERVIIEYKGWRIAPFICFDLRFPAWVRNTKEVDFQFFVANWPDKRVEHWKALLKARAIENQVYIAGVNRYGYDGNKIYHSGASSVYDPMGECLTEINHAETFITLELNKEKIEKTRRHMPFLNEQDTFEIV